MRAMSLARPFVLWDTRPLMTVGWERPFGVGADPLGERELLVSPPSDACWDVALLERGCVGASIMTKAVVMCKYTLCVHAHASV